jgi:putative mycofactocin binding protein MftB
MDPVTHAEAAPQTRHYRLAPHVKVRREAFGGILYHYDCGTRGDLVFLKSALMVELCVQIRDHPGADVVELLCAVAGGKRITVEAIERVLAHLRELERREFLVEP